MSVILLPILILSLTISTADPNLVEEHGEGDTADDTTTRLGLYCRL